jgi:hypothetical protein
MMPRRFIDRPDELQIPAGYGSADPVRAFFIRKAIGRHPLPRPLHALHARGVYVPPPPPGSRGVVVKVWPASPSTSAAHTRYLTRGKGLDGMDAPLFGDDPQRFTQAAQQDAHQFRLIFAVREYPGLSLEELARAWLARVSDDLHTTLSWLGAVHHDTPHPHVHVQLRGATPNGQPLYLTKPYYFHGLRHRLQELLTEWCGRLRPGQVQEEREALRQIQTQIVDRPHQPRITTPIRRLTPEQIAERLREHEANLTRLRAAWERRGRGRDHT